MVKNLKRFRKQVEREQGRLEALKCDFFPTTYVLPVRVIRVARARDGHGRCVCL
jgi:hypothetical protein